jgi:hypothetical protein
LTAAPDLRLELSPAPALAAGIVALHAGAAACAYAALPGAAGGALAAALVALGLAAAWSRALLRAPESVRRIEIGDEQVRLGLTSGAELAAEVAERRYVSRFVVALPVRRPGRRVILVTRGMLAGDAFRRLRIWALWGRLPGAANAQLPA